MPATVRRLREHSRREATCDFGVGAPGGFEPVTDYTFGLRTRNRRISSRADSAGTPAIRSSRLSLTVTSPRPRCVTRSRDGTGAGTGVGKGFDLRRPLIMTPRFQASLR